MINNFEDLFKIIENEWRDDTALTFVLNNTKTALNWYNKNANPNDLHELSILYYAIKHYEFVHSDLSEFVKSKLSLEMLEKIEDNINSALLNDDIFNDTLLIMLINESLIPFISINQNSGKYLELLNNFEFKTVKAKKKFGTELRQMKKSLKEDKKSMKQNQPSRGIETMFRTTSKNHLDLSAIADNKANILLSINVILISIIVSALATKLDSHPFLLIPTIMILVVSMTTIILATISTLPKITDLKMTREDIDAKKGNLLFFGNFAKMSLDDYEYGMNELMKDKEYLYNSMVKDIYFLGLVLNRKYRILRYAYLIFMIGLALSIIGFILAIILTS